MDEAEVSRAQERSLSGSGEMRCEGPLALLGALTLVSFPYALGNLLMIYFVIGLGMCAAIDLLLLPAAVPLALGFIGCAIKPEWCYEIFGSAALGAFSTLSFLWQASPSERLRNRSLPRPTDHEKPASR